MNERHLSQDNEDGENNNDHPDAEPPARPASLDQDAALSTTSNEVISSPKRTTPSAPLVSFKPSHKAGAPSTGPSLTGAPLADAGKPGFRGTQTGSYKAPKPDALSFIGQDTGRHEPQASITSHQLLAFTEPEETGPPASSTPHRSRTFSAESREPGPHTLPASNKTLLEVASSLAPSTATSLEDIYGQLASGTSTGQNHGQSRRISSGSSLTLEDLNPPGYSSPNDGTEADLRDMVSPANSQLSLGLNLPSTDPYDPNFFTDQDLYESTTKFYTWNYLEGSGRHDSNVDSAWIYNDVEIGGDLMDFRDRVIKENGGLTEPHEKLVVNFVFLVEGDHQTRGLHVEIEDEPWAALCEATRDQVDPLPKVTVDEAHQWVRFLARESPDSFKARLRASPPNDPSLQSILNLMVSSGQLWNSESCNEDTYLKSWLGPFLQTYFSSITFTTSGWTQTQEETRNTDSSLLVPDFATVTVTKQGEVSLVLLEGKVASNKGFQIWDDRTKLGQGMKLALDSIVMLSPKDEVCVVGILVREPLAEFFTMQIHAEGTYIMRRFAICYIAADHMNMLPIITMMEAFQHALVKVKKTLAAIRRVRIRPSPNPKVPLSWLRPSFNKPTKTLVLDGE
ncbi:hypothetical protein BGZ54_002092 [Gamsiella multidivaricata]|nr:hypothetical protein BGZ54_002092 [Gamsiella multidivaricata]